MNQYLDSNNGQGLCLLVKFFVSGAKHLHAFLILELSSTEIYYSCALPEEQAGVARETEYMDFNHWAKSNHLSGLTKMYMIFGNIKSTFHTTVNKLFLSILISLL